MAIYSGPPEHRVSIKIITSPFFHLSNTSSVYLLVSVKHTAQLWSLKFRARRFLRTMEKRTLRVWKFCACAGKLGAVYLMGYFHVHAGWLLGLVTFIVLRQEWQDLNRTRRKVLKTTGDIKQVLEFGNIHDLPTWATFPDTESVEWANEILKEIWLHAKHHVKSLLKTKVQSMLNKKIPNSFVGFKFIDAHVGDTAPRIQGLKVYKRRGVQSEIIVDIDISYHGDDELTFTLIGTPGSLKDISLQGKMRAILKNFNEDIPFVGGIQLYFISQPIVDFDYTGFAGPLHTPLLHETFKKSIVQKLTGPLTFPRKVSLALSKKHFSDDLYLTDIEGVLRIHVIEAKELENKDHFLFGKSDPYAVITVGAQKVKTKTINNSLEPIWDLWSEFCIECSDKMVVKCDVYDHDTTGKDELLGRISLDMSDLISQGFTDKWITLNSVKNGKIHLKTLWLQPSEDVADLNDESCKELGMDNNTTLARAVLIVFIHSANNLNSNAIKSSGKTPCPEMFISVGNEKYSASVSHMTHNPTYKKGFHFLIRDPKSEKLFISFVDKNSKNHLGDISFPLSDLLEKEGLTIVTNTLPLNNTDQESTVVVSMKLRVLVYYENQITKILSEHSKKNEPAESISSTLTPSLSYKRSPSLKGDLAGGKNIVKPVEIRLPEPSHNVPPSSLPRKSPIPKVERKVSTTESIHSRMERKVSRVDRIATENDQHRNSPELPERKMSHYEKIPTTNPQKRHNSMMRPDGRYGLGRIQITMRYAQQRSSLVVSVHKIQNLPIKDPRDLPDPYVKMYLLPSRSKETKRKTQNFKDDCNPLFDETFTYLLPLEELSGKQLEVTVLSKKNWKGASLGQVKIDLSQDLTQPVTAWYDLQPVPTKTKQF